MLPPMSTEGNGDDNDTYDVLRDELTDRGMSSYILWGA